jgi:carboxypeptidase PM20D1
MSSERPRFLVRHKRPLAALAGGLATLLVVLLGRATGSGHAPELHEPLELQVDLDRVTQTLSQYIRIDTSTPPGILASPPPPHLALLVERYVEPLGLEHEIVAGRSLLVRFRSGDAEGRPMLLLSHADVVPVGEDELASWTHAPFAGDIAGGFVWGRGALDNKASTVCQLEAIAALKRAGLDPRRDVLLLVLPDEEIGGRLGAGLVLDRYEDLLEDPWVVLDEGGSIVSDVIPDVPFAAVAVAEKHYVTIELSVEAESGHASMPREGDAPRVLSEALGKLARWQHPARLLPVHERFLDRMADHAPLGRRIALKNRWLLGGLVERQLSSRPATNATIRDTMSVTMLRGGVKDNVVPARASAVVNMRLLPGSELEAVLARIEHTIADPRVHVEVLSDWGDTPVASFDDDRWDGLESAVATALPGVPVIPILSPGTMDARWFAQAGIPSYRFLPFTLDAEERGRIHGIDERISRDNLEQGVRVYAHVMRYW